MAGSKSITSQREISLAKYNNSLQLIALIIITKPQDFREYFAIFPQQPSERLTVFVIAL